MHPTEKNKIVIDEEVAPIVRRIFALALSGMSCRNIAALLNQEGVPTPATYANLPVAKPGPYTGLWSSERISDMLQNETYIGNMVQGKYGSVSYKPSSVSRVRKISGMLCVVRTSRLLTRNCGTRYVGGEQSAADRSVMENWYFRTQSTVHILRLYASVLQDAGPALSAMSESAYLCGSLSRCVYCGQPFGGSCTGRAEPDGAGISR